MTRLNMRGLLALVLTVLTLGLGQVPASAQMIGRVPYLSSNPCKGVTLSLAFAKSTGSNCLGGNRYASASNIPGWTYTGGASTGSYAAKADGSLQLFANNAPRITDAGYWAEEARTNTALWSQDFTNAAWTKSGAIATAAYATDPAGTTTANRIVKSAGSANSTLAEQIVAGGAASQTHTFSIWVKSNTGSSQVFALKLTQQAVADNFSADLTATTTWQRFTFSRTFTAGGTGNAIVGPVLASTGAAADLQIWGAQFEGNSSFATSPIPTTSVAVTRAADVGYVSGLVVPSASTLLASATVQGPSGIRTAASLTSGATANRTPLFVRGDNVIMLQVDDATVNQYYGDASTATAGQTYSAAARLVTGDIRMAAKGALSTTATAGTVPTASLNRLVVGADGSGSGSPAQGPIRRVVIYPRAFGNAELQAATIGPVSFANDNAAPDDMKAALWGWVA